MQYGAYVQLLNAAQADADPAHRQLAMDELARIGPVAGSTRADGSCAADPLAEAILRKLYPPRPQTEPPAPTPPLPAAIAALMAEYEAKAAALIRDHTAR